MFWKKKEEEGRWSSPGPLASSARYQRESSFARSIVSRARDVPSRSRLTLGFGWKKIWDNVSYRIR